MTQSILLFLLAESSVIEDYLSYIYFMIYIYIYFFHFKDFLGETENTNRGLTTTPPQILNLRKFQWYALYRGEICNSTISTSWLVIYFEGSYRKLLSYRLFATCCRSKWPQVSWRFSACSYITPTQGESLLPGNVFCPRLSVKVFNCDEKHVLCRWWRSVTIATVNFPSTVTRLLSLTEVQR